MLVQGEERLLRNFFSTICHSPKYRAWLRTADEAKRFQQTQLMLVLKNIGFPIARMDGVYTSVMAVWTKAMTTLDKLIQGMPHSVQEGAVLLGLSAWHLYPDMLVEGHQRTEILQRDNLINQGGLITLGLASADPNRDDGIYWSLPLAHLRYYGDPVIRSASAGDQSSRVSIDQLQQVALGSILRAWEKTGTDLSVPIALIDYLFTVVYPDATERPRWVRTVATIAQRYLQSQDQDRAKLSRLVHLGIRKCPDFIADTSSHPAAVFGLANMRTLIGLCSSLETKLACLREVAGTLDVHNIKGLLIRFRGERTYHFTYLMPKPHQGTKRTRIGTSKTALDAHWTIDEDLYPDVDDLLARSRFADELINGRLIAMCPTAINMPPVPHELVFGDPDSAAVFRAISELKVSNCPSPNTIELSQVTSVLASKCIDRSEVRRYFISSAYHEQSPQLKYYDSLDALDEAKTIFGELSNSSANLAITSKPLHTWQWRSAPREGQEPSLAHAFACIAAFETGNLDLDPVDISKAAVMALSYGNSMYVAERLLSDPLEVLVPYAIRRIIGNIGRPGLSLLVPPQRPRLPKPDFNSWNCINHNVFNGLMEDNFSGTSLHLSFSEYKLAVDTGMHGQRDQEACYVEAIVSAHHRGKWIADLDILRADKRWMSYATYVERNSFTNHAKPENRPPERKRLESSDMIRSDIREDRLSLPSDGQEGSASSEPLFLDSALNDFLFDKYDGLFSKKSFGDLKSDWIHDIESRLRNRDGEYSFELTAPDDVCDTETADVPHDTTICQHLEEDRMDVSGLMPLVSIDSWAEFLDPPAMNAVVRAWGNKLGRLSLAAVAMQKGYNIHIVGKDSCWKCDFEQCSTEEQHNERMKKAGGTRGQVHTEDPPEGSFHLFIC